MGTPPARSLWWVAARSGVMAAIAGAATGVVLAVLCWLPDAGVSGKPSSAIRSGLLAFLAAQHGGITVDGVPARFVPLAMMIAVAFLAWRAGRVLAEAATAARETVPRRLLLALAASAVGYTASCAVLVPLARLGTSHAPLPWTPIAALLLFTLVAGASLARGSALTGVFAARVPAVLPGAARGAAMAIAVYLGAGAVLLAGSLILHAHRVMAISGEVGGGLSGLPVLLVGALCVPNGVVAATSYLAGPGFSIGSGSAVNAFSTSHGLLPALPILGAVPDGHGANPPVLALMALTPLLAGIGAAVGVWSAVKGALLAGELTGVAMAMLTWLSGGAAGTGRLRVVGASPWQVGLAIAVPVSVLALLMLAALAGWDRVFTRPAEPVAGRVRELADAGRR
jgi:hypothetical protein